MHDLKRRITKLEQDVGHEMMFIVYTGNREPMSLKVGDRRVDRSSGETWAKFMQRVVATANHERFAIGEMNCVK